MCTIETTNKIYKPVFALFLYKLDLGVVLAIV
jgi:hypothetical protein